MKQQIIAILNKMYDSKTCADCKHFNSSECYNCNPDDFEFKESIIEEYAKNIEDLFPKIKPVIIPSTYTTYTLQCPRCTFDVWADALGGYAVCNHCGHSFDYKTINDRKFRFSE